MSKYLIPSDSSYRESDPPPAFIIAICISCSVHFAFFSLKNDNNHFSSVHLPLQVVISQIESSSDSINSSGKALHKSKPKEVSPATALPERPRSNIRQAITTAVNKHVPSLVIPTYPSSIQNPSSRPEFERKITPRTSTMLRKASYFNNPPPKYPGRARRMGLEGELLLRVRVLQNGSTDQLIIKKSSGSSLLDNAAVSAVSGWQFIPAYQGNKTISSWVEIPIRFKLDT